MSEDNVYPLSRYESAGEIELGRGDVISSIDLATLPGDYPVYSSSAVGSGEFGRYGRYMFDEELITWSIDGGGRPFYRPKHRYSVTNVCGYLRIRRPDLWSYRYLHALLEKLQSGIQFDYQMKAHPSVIRELYRFKRIPLEEQKLIGQILDALDTALRETEAIIGKLKAIKQGLLHDLLTRGINANGELRPPQAEAPHLYKQSPLGWIPRQWDAMQLGDATEMQVGFAFKSDWFVDEASIRLLRGDNVGFGVLDWSSPKFLPDIIARNYSEYLLKEGDVVVGMDRTFTKSGAKFSVVSSNDLPCLLVQRVGRFAPTKVSVEFLRQLSAWPAFHRELMAQQKGMDIPHLSKSDILSPTVPVPCFQEQAEICTRLDALDRRIADETALHSKLSVEMSALSDDLLSGSPRITPLLDAERAQTRSV